MPSATVQRGREDGASESSSSLQICLCLCLSRPASLRSFSPLTCPTAVYRLPSCVCAARVCRCGGRWLVVDCLWVERRLRGGEAACCLLLRFASLLRCVTPHSIRSTSDTLHSIHPANQPTHTHTKTRTSLERPPVVMSLTDGSLSQQRTKRRRMWLACLLAMLQRNSAPNVPRLGLHACVACNGAEKLACKRLQ